MTVGRSRRTFLRAFGLAGAALAASGVRRRWAWAATPPELTLAGVAIRYQTLPIRYLSELRDDFERVTATAAVSDNTVFRSYIDHVDFATPAQLPEARSIVIVALADRITRIDFTCGGRRRPVLVAPGYVRLGIEQENLAGFVVEKIIADRSRKVVPARLPLKLLAARSGLGEYGRNNICFIPGLGSYHALRAFYTDHDFGEDTWTPLRLLRICRGCDICIRRCPTRAIRPDVFVVDAGRCLTLYNELPEPIPQWVPRTSHNSLVGCMSCQLECPANNAPLDKATPLATVSEAETTLLLNGARDDRLEASISSKLAALGLAADLDHLARNLRLVLDA